MPVCPRIEKCNCNVSSHNSDRKKIEMRPLRIPPQVIIKHKNVFRMKILNQRKPSRMSTDHEKSWSIQGETFVKTNLPKNRKM